MQQKAEMISVLLCRTGVYSIIAFSTAKVP